MRSESYMGKPGHAHVFYEDITDDSRKESMRLFDELDLSWDEGVLERYAATAQSVIATGESWKQGNVQEIRRRTNDRLVHNGLQRMVLKILESQYRKIRANA